MPNDNTFNDDMWSRYAKSKDYQFNQPMQSSQSEDKNLASSDSLKPSPEFVQGASRGAGGGLGSMLVSGGVASANPYAIAGGVGLMALEGDAQAKQAEEEAKASEAQQRKQAQMTAINNLISVSKGLSVM